MKTRESALRRRIRSKRARVRIVVLAAGLALLVLPSGCCEHGAGTDTGSPDAGDAHVGQDVLVGDARVDAAPIDTTVPDAQVDAAPNANVIVLPPSGQTEIAGFSNGGFLAVYSDQRGTALLAQDVYYYDVLARQEVQVTSREMNQMGPYTDGLEIMYSDSSFLDELNGVYRVELYSYSIPLTPDLLT